jgi:predicted RNA binding protein with dsRBD fold (UPF0201 family)
MVRIELQPAEAEALKSALENYLSELRMEIASTDAKDFREVLKTRKSALRKVLAMLEERAGQDAA